MRKMAYAGIFGLFIILGWGLVVPDPTFPGSEPQGLRTGIARRNTPPQVMGASVARGVAGKEHVSMSYAQLPFAFELNRGQTDPRVMFVARGSGYTLFLASGEAVLSLRSAGPKPPVQRQMAGLAGRGSPLARPDARVAGKALPPLLSEHSLSLPAWPHRQFEPEHQAATAEPAPASVLRLRLVNANPNAHASGLEELPGKSNYFIGKDAKKWRTNVPNYAKVRFQDVYPGVDLVYYGNQRRLEHDFVVSPGADPSKIELAIEGADSLRLDGKGNLVAQTASGQLLLRKPAVYQPGNPKLPIQNLKSVEGRFVLLAKNRAGFEVGDYDRTQPLVIDPVVEYSTYLGGSGYDYAEAIAVDADGNAYVAGVTNSPDFPFTVGTYPITGDAVTSAFVTKLNPAGSAIEYTAYLGGAATAGGVAVNSAGELYVAGSTYGDGFPTTAGALQAAVAGYADVFISKLSATGSELLYSTFLGGSDQEDRCAPAIAVDSSGNAYITGSTLSDDFPTTPGAFDRTCGSDGRCNREEGQYWVAYPDAFVAKLDPTGTTLVYSTYLGGSGDENSAQWYHFKPSIIVDASGNAIVSGITLSPDFPTTDGAFRSAIAGGIDVFVAKLDPSGASMVSSTYLGGSGYDTSSGLALDTAGNVIVAGLTFSEDFPTTAGAFKTTCTGCASYYFSPTGDNFAAKFSHTGSALVYSTYLGGVAGNQVNGIAVDSRGNTYAVGAAAAAGPDPWLGFTGLYQDAILAKLNPSGTAPLFTLNLGPADPYGATGVALDSGGNAYVVGGTTLSQGRDFAPTSGAFQTSPAGGLDVFVAKISSTPGGPSVCPFPDGLYFGNQILATTSSEQRLTVTNDGDELLNISSFTVDSDFDLAEATTCLNPMTLAPGASCDAYVNLTPAATGIRTGTLSIVSNAPGSPHTLPLQGNGTDFSISLTPASQTINAGQTATYSLNVNRVAGFDEPLTADCIGAPEQSTCGIEGDWLNPPGVTLTVRTTARSMMPPVRPLPPVTLIGKLALPMLCAMLAAVLASLLVKPRRRAVAAMAAVVAAVLLWATCGGGSIGGGGNNPAPQVGTPAGTYSLTITGTTGMVSRQASVSLTVK